MKFLLCLFVVLVLNVATLAADCGRRGSIVKRVEQCNKEVGDFSLVLRKGKAKVYIENSTGLLWSLSFKNTQAFPEAILNCQRSFKGLGIISSKYSWRVPTVNNYMRAFEHGLFNGILKDKETGYWALKGGKYWMHSAYVFYLQDNVARQMGSRIKLGHVRGHEKYIERSVSCVGVRSKK